jgi:hypothetical protein
MFGFGFSEKKELQKLRAGFEQIRQHILLRMNEFEQYSFVTAFDNLPEEYSLELDDDLVRSKDDWKHLANDLQDFGKEGYKMYSGASGMHGEGGRAGMLSVNYLFLYARANVLSEPAAQLLIADIKSFRREATAKVQKQIETRARSR